MAVSKLKKTILSKTITGQADSNGFVSSGLRSDQTIVIGCNSLMIDGADQVAFFTRILTRGGSGGTDNTLQFENWSHTTMGQNKTITATIFYIPI